MPTHIVGSGVSAERTGAREGDILWAINPIDLV